MYCSVRHVEAVAIGALHGLDLAFLARRPQALAAAVGGHAQAPDDGLNRIAIGQARGSVLSTRPT